VPNSLGAWQQGEDTSSAASRSVHRDDAQCGAERVTCRDKLGQRATRKEVGIQQDQERVFHNTAIQRRWSSLNVVGSNGGVRSTIGRSHPGTKWEDRI